MLIGDFDTGTMKHSALYRDARLAMLTHQVLRHMELTRAAVGGVEHALADSPRPPTGRPATLLVGHSQLSSI
ncbi:hypothetical protein C7I87_32740 [Mesorhizobium sp. SARCC-RB16n]|uniref:hypothetical protein n=1 Tax=Mesorhizobium sp. SARCC-RB16n TaxID=2116687 RepID=UPI00122F8AFD|nr:hypothetical protein [Mesorhizobium sp. SARCC-RB16n]KAA3442071.1 hypothetical protein C7I87_32740 [Mesorhizobium sp. SARCC-RB16n]